MAAATVRLAQGLVAAATLAGVALYGGLRFLYDRFYGGFGIRPEEVGLDFLAIVGHAGVAIASFFLLMMLFILLGIGLASAVFAAFRPPPERPRLPRFRLGRRIKPGLVIVAALVLPFILAIGTDATTSRLAKTYVQVKKGFAIRPSGLLQIRVEPVVARWISAPRTKTARFRNMMLLGTGGGTAFVFDLDRQSLVRLPVNAVELTQRCHPAYPDICVAPQAPDLDCRDLPRANVQVREPDPYEFDADGDLVGCEGETLENDAPSARIGGLLFFVTFLMRLAVLWGFKPLRE